MHLTSHWLYLAISFFQRGWILNDVNILHPYIPAFIHLSFLKQQQQQQQQALLTLKI